MAHPILQLFSAPSLFNGQVLFAGEGYSDYFVQGTGLWVTNGTDAGTYQVSANPTALFWLTPLSSKTVFGQEQY
jgi:hypothetical protein